MDYYGSSSYPGGIEALMAVMLIPLIISLAILVLSLVCNWMIASKAGYSGAASLLLLIPFVGFIFYIIFAFSKWPVLQELEQRRLRG
jgi:uncharacterized membrane protein YhaH (DUF805 family)